MGEKGKVILSVEVVLKYLFWLLDVDIVFKEVLGLYDLYLVVMVVFYV